MSYEFYNVLFYLSIFVFIGLLVVLIVFKFRKSKYLHTFSEDSLFKSYVDTGVNNEVYGTKGNVKNYIKRYVLRKSSYDKSIICNYSLNFKELSYYVVCYDKKGNECGAVVVNEKNNNKSSKIIGLPKKTNQVNIVIKNADNLKLNNSIIAPISVRNIRLYSLITTVMFFNLAFVLSMILLKLISKEHIKLYCESDWFFFAFLALLVFTVIMYLITVITLRHRNSKNRTGGMDYEFD